MQFKTRGAVQPGQQLSATHLPSHGGQKALLQTMFLRLETALGRSNVSKEIMLLSRPKPSSSLPKSDDQSISFVVGYSGSAHSQAALDLALFVAHQTRLIKPNPVIVHVVYVVDKTKRRTIANADRILWQARCLASEWRGALNAHLRIGQVADELSQVAREIDAEMMLLGCHTVKHPLVKQLVGQTPCSVLGLPQ